MASHSIVAAFLLLLAFASSPSSAEKPFDFYQLVLLWPGAFCTKSLCCRPTAGEPQNDFFVRGFWSVSNATGRVVIKCSTDPFNLDQLSDLANDLHAYWSNIRCPSNDGELYWKRAWTTYGGCSGLSEADYFKTALQLRAKVDVLTALSKKEITPSLSYVYGASDIENAIAQAVGAKPVIRCNEGAAGALQLFEVYICVAKDGKTIIECPVKPRFTCSDDIFFAPFDVNSLKNNPTANPIEMPLSTAE